jgi:hypothetical protein
MRVVHAVIALTVAACNGDIDGGDDDSGGGGDGGGGGDSGGGIDAPPVVGEPPGLVGTTDAHNVERASHGVPPLTWDPALAAIAQAWAEQCVDTMAPTGLIDHNPNRGQNYPESVGENIYGSGGQASGTAAVALWIQEEANYNLQNNTCSGVCGHWTQVVWRTTTKVGCGLHNCPGLQFGSSVVCNYAPAGNSGGPPF